MQNERHEMTFTNLQGKAILTFALYIFYFAIRSFAQFMSFTHRRFEAKLR